MRILHSPLLLCSLMLAVQACPGDDASMDEGAGTVGTGSTTTDSPTTTTEPGTTAETTEPGTTAETTSGDTMITTVTTTESDSTATGADTETTGPGGSACGDAECGAEEWCDFSDGVCGAKGSSGTATCEAKPEGCGDVYQPVCGCDGQVHGNDCDASVAGVDVDAEGDCETPEGFFRCGYRFCNPAFEYCQIQYSDVGGVGHSYTCVQAGDMCPDGVITCDCLTEEPCFEFGCDETPDGGYQIGCPGG